MTSKKKKIKAYYHRKSSVHEGRQQDRKKRNEGTIKHPKNNNMVLVIPYISVITLNVNGLTAPIKSHRVARWLKEKEPTICSPQEIHFSFKDTHRLKVKWWKKILHASGIQQRTRIAILISQKLDKSK